MKRLHLHIITAFFFCSVSTYAQHCSEEINTPPGSTIDIYDWTQGLYDFVLGTPGNIVYETVQSPFFDGASNDNIYHLNNPTVKDFSPGNGWELVVNDFGTEDNPVATPFLVLYNRYEGVLRVLVWIQQGLDGYDNAKLTMRYVRGEINQSAALNLINSPTTALDAWPRNNTMVAPNDYINLITGFWLFADYPIAYDPCTCNYSSSLQVRADLIEVSTISLLVEGGGEIEQVLSSGNNSFSLSKIVNGINDSGTKVSKSISNFTSTGEKIYDAFGLLYVQNSVQAYDSLSDAGKKKFDKEFKKALKLPDWVKGLSDIGYVLGIAEYLIGGGKTTAAKPISFEANLKFDVTGNTIDEDSHGAIDIYTPGSLGGMNAERAVVYDNILGVFTLFSTPKIHKVPDTEHPPHAYKFQLSEPLEYAVNPAAGLELVDLKAALVFESSCGSDMPIFDLPTSSTVFFLESEGGKSRWQTPFYPASCLEDIVIQAGNFSAFLDACHYRDIRVKLMATFERDPEDPFYDPDADQVLYMVEYVSNVSFVPEITATNELDQIPLSTTVADITLEADQTIYAWSTIEIGDNIVTNGHRLTLIAGGEIIGRDNDLLEDVDLLIGHPAFCEAVLPPQAPEQLQNFCTSGTYNPVGSRLTTSTTEGALKTRLSEESMLDLTVIPNPFQEYIEFQYAGAVGESAEVTITDSMGRMVAQFKVVLEDLNQQFRIDTKNWANGFYAFHLRTKNNYASTIIVKQ